MEQLALKVLMSVTFSYLFRSFAHLDSNETSSATAERARVVHINHTVYVAKIRRPGLHSVVDSTGLAGLVNLTQ